MTKRTRQSFDVTTAEGQKRLMYESVGMAYAPRTINPGAAGDYGTDPAGNGMVRMVPSGDIVTVEEARRRLARKTP